MGRKTARENSCGLTIARIKAISFRIIFKVLGSTSGKMARFIKEGGRITKCMEMGHSPGLMEGSMSDSTLKT